MRSLRRRQSAAGPDRGGGAARATARPLLAATLVAVSIGAGASPAGTPLRPRDTEVAAAELPVPASTTSTSPSTTTAVAPTTTTAAAPSTTVPPPTATSTTGRRPVPTTAQSITRAPAPPAAVSGPLASVSPPPARDISVYRGLGTWIDAYDFSPQFQANGAPPPITPESMDDLAAAGVRTLYLQAAKDDIRSPGNLVNPEILGPMLLRAHANGIKVVAWYLPKFYDLDSDMRRLVAMRDFRADGDGFDGLGLDIEWTRDVPDPKERSRRLVELSRRLRAAVGGTVLSAIPLPPVLIETVNPRYWPGFPWRELAPLYDVWMPMAYWTFRTRSSGYRDAYRYTAENVRRVRANLGLPDAVVHPIGGTDNKSTQADYRDFVRACADSGSVGGSIYDWRTTPRSSFAVLRGVPG